MWYLLIFYSVFFFFSCPCYDYSLEVLARDKHWLFTLIFVVTSKCKCKWGAGLAKFPNYSPLISQEMQRGDWLTAMSNQEPIYLLPQSYLPFTQDYIYLFYQIGQAELVFLLPVKQKAL